MNDTSNAVAREMPRYKCHKDVWALKIETITPNENPDKTGQGAASSYGARIVPAEDGYGAFDVDADYVNKHRPEAGGYYVVYGDGYRSYSPAAAFESGYTLKSDNAPTEYGSHASAVLYPAIEAAMNELDQLPPAFNFTVNRAFNILHGAFWSECPAPASASPLRTAPCNTAV